MKAQGAETADALASYFDELLHELNQLNALRRSDPTILIHSSALLNEEIRRVWSMMYNQPAGDNNNRKTPVREPLVQRKTSDSLTLREKIPIPDIPEGKDSHGRKCNLIGRILGPSGLSVKQLEAETGCQILIRGHGSVKDSYRQSRLRGTPGWEHLDEPLHVVVTATDTNPAKAEEKLNKGAEVVRRLLQPSHDEYKKRQLIQLAIINGTYRHSREE